MEVDRSERQRRHGRPGPVLYTFTADAVWALQQGIDAVACVRPIHFRWPLFLLGFVMILWAGLRVTWPGRSRLLRI